MIGSTDQCKMGKKYKHTDCSSSTHTCIAGKKDQENPRTRKKEEITG